MLIQSMVLLIAMYGCKSWTAKESDRKVNLLEISWSRGLRLPRTTRKIAGIYVYQSEPEYSLEMTNVKLSNLDIQC